MKRPQVTWTLIGLPLEEKLLKTLKIIGSPLTVRDFVYGHYHGLTSVPMFTIKKELDRLLAEGKVVITGKVEPPGTMVNTKRYLELYDLAPEAQRKPEE